MANVNVTDVILDPDFVDPITVVVRKPAINSYGENSVSEISVNTFGSVQPATGKAIQRLPEALRVADILSFWLREDISANSPNQYPSILIFKGRRYQVQMVFDWSSWGAGWSEGVCIAEVPA